ncbi:MAG: hypothetical protein MSC31_04550, partial [Solirubrobacteraceae bacterium MAG38_C4-C5]|nr:hypothetical protein [Candidatus Siliceabacter maunaloa]
MVVRYGDRELDLEVADDGRGPGPERNGQGHGIIGMRERVTLYLPFRTSRSLFLPPPFGVL